MILAVSFKMHAIYNKATADILVKLSHAAENLTKENTEPGSP